MWPRENVVKLLNIYKKFPSLYDSSHPDYLNKYKRGKTYENLLDHVKRFDPKMDMELLKIKIHTIRSQLLKELRTEYLFYKTRPPGSKEVFESKYWAFNRLQFLKPFCTVKKYNLLKKNYDLINVKEEESNDEQDSWINMSPKENNESMDDAISDEPNSEWFNWTRELTEELIVQYEMHPILYDIDHPDHLYHFRRAKAYQKILTELRKTSPNIRIDLIKRKLHSLRNQFVKEYQAEQKSQEKGSDIDEIYVPKLWCYTQLSFLKQFCKQGSSQSTTKIYKQSISDDNSDVEDSVPVQHQRTNDVFCNRTVLKFDDDSDGLSDNPADDDDYEDDVDDDDDYDDLDNYDYDDCDDDYDDPLFGTDIVNNSNDITTKIKGSGRAGGGEGKYSSSSSASLKRKFNTESRLPNQFIKYENNNLTPLRKQQKYHRREEINSSPLSSISPPPKSPTPPPLRRIPTTSTLPATTTTITPKLSTNDIDCGAAVTATTSTTTTRSTAERERYYENLCEQILQKVNDSLETKVTDEYDLIGKQIAFKLRKLSVDVKTMAEKFINDILFHAEIGNINKRTIMDIKTETIPTPTLSRPRTANHFMIHDNVNGLLNINNLDKNQIQM